MTDPVAIERQTMTDIANAIRQRWSGTAQGGDATAADIALGKTAYVNGVLITGTAVIPQSDVATDDEVNEALDELFDR